jgi:hypothetical protein
MQVVDAGRWPGPTPTAADRVTCAGGCCGAPPPRFRRSCAPARAPPHSLHSARAVANPAFRKLRFLSEPRPHPGPEVDRVPAAPARRQLSRRPIRRPVARQRPDAISRYQRPRRSAGAGRQSVLAARGGDGQGGDAQGWRRARWRRARWRRARWRRARWRRARWRRARWRRAGIACSAAGRSSRRVG